MSGYVIVQSLEVAHPVGASPRGRRGSRCLTRALRPSGAEGPHQMRAAVAASMAPLSDCRQRLPSPRSRVAAAGPPSSPRPTLAGLSLGLDIAGGADHLVEWADEVDDGLNAFGVYEFRETAHVRLREPHSSGNSSARDGEASERIIVGMRGRAWRVVERSVVRMAGRSVVR